MKVKKLALTGVLTALAFVLYEYVSLPIPPTSSPLITLSFGIIPIFLIAYFCGTFYAASAAVIVDILGYFLVGASKGYAFNIGYTFNALLSGLIIGVILEFKDKLNSKKGTLFIILFESVFTILTLTTFIISFKYTDIGERMSNKGMKEGAELIIILFSLILNSSIVLYAIFSRNKDYDNALNLSLIIYMSIVSLLLTPLWISLQGRTIGFYFYLWVTRLVTVPIEILIYSILIRTLMIPLNKINKRFDR